MKRYIALLRGINVGGRHSLPMKELRALLEKLGLEGVKTYIQSGNVVFWGEESQMAGLADTIGAEIQKRHGFEPRVMLLPMEALEQAIQNNPFREVMEEPKSLHFYFLSEPAKNPDQDALESLKLKSERFALIDKVFYLYAPDGIGRSKLAEKVERLLGVAVTARSWRTVETLLRMAQEED